MQVFRICDRRFDPFNGVGASLVGGRWNSPGKLAVYAGQSCAIVLLEMFVRVNGTTLPDTHDLIVADVPTHRGVSQVSQSQMHKMGWDNVSECRRIGDAWLEEGKNLLLQVPSVVTRHDFNVLVNPQHVAFKEIKIEEPQPIFVDGRFRFLPDASPSEDESR